MPTIVKLTGTSGSGKSTIAHWLLKNYKHIPLGKRPTTRKVAKDEDYLIQLPQTNTPLILLGNYDNQCGGCDGIQPYSRIVEKLLAITTSHPKAHILMEGLLIRGYGSVGAFMDNLPKRWKIIYATMDTPLEVCLERIKQRRAKKGVTEPLNPKNTEQKFKSGLSDFRTLSERGFECVWIDHKRPVKSVLSLYGVKLAKEPRHG
jgi:predicted kinase